MLLPRGTPRTVPKATRGRTNEESSINGKEREDLIRRIFEAERDVAWTENVEGKARGM